MKIVLVPTILRGVNDHQVGDIVRFALDRMSTIAGISFQPVAFTGRISTARRLAQRYTLTDMAHDVSQQTGLADPYDDWFPLACIQPFTRLLAAIRGQANIVMSCHPHCSLGTYLFMGCDGKAVPVSQFFDLKGLLDDMWRWPARPRPAASSSSGKPRRSWPCDGTGAAIGRRRA